MALPPFPPVPNTRLVDDPARDAVWRRWLEQLSNRVEPLDTGTVTSVALTMPTDVFDVSGSPITTSGTLAVTFDTQTANTVFSGPTTGSAAAPTFRALVPADIPAATPLTVGTTPIVSGAVNRLLYEGAGNLLAESANLTFDGTILTVTGVVSVPDGSAAAPSIKIGDEQNGFFSSATSAIGLSLNGGQLFTWNTSGFTISISGGGADRRIQCVNTSNTAGSGSKLQAQVAGTSAGDAYAQYNISGGINWAVGLDNSDSDSFKISQNATLGTNDYLTITTAGVTTLTSLVATTADINAGTIDGTTIEGGVESTLLGRGQGSGAGVTQSIALGSGLSMSGATLSATGTGGTVTSVAQSFTGGLISVSGSPITTSGTLALTVAGTSGGIPYFSAADAWASSALLAANALMIGGGAGAAPATTTTGTGVVTALGVNTGTAGAFVVNGGALGTPSSGTVTNLTGTASININGTVGATTPTTGVFTTLTVNTEAIPDANDGAALGNASTAWSDLFLAEGGVINWDNGDVTITQTGNELDFAGASTGYNFDSNTYAPNFAYEAVTLNDDQAGYWTFSAADSRGIAVISGNTDSAGSAMVAFRVGSSIFCRSLASGISAGAVATTTGALTGTTGTNGNLTLSVTVTATGDRLYIENRTGATRGYVITFLSMAVGIPTSFTTV